MTATIVIVFGLVYLGMILGGLPFLQLDRTGIALLGAIALVGMGVVTPEAAVQALHLPTLILLFAFMVLSAQLRLGGFYAWVTLQAGGAAADAAAIAGRADRRGGGAGGGIQQRHRVPGGRAGADRRLPAAGPRSHALPAGPGLRRQRRLGRDADRQPPEHADRRDLAAVLRRLRPRSGGAGAARPAGDLGDHRLAGAGTLDGAAGRSGGTPAPAGRGPSRLRPLADRQGADGGGSAARACSSSPRGRARRRRWSARACC